MKRVTLNAAEMKSFNRRLILDHLRQQGASRAELSRKTGLTRAAIGVIADQLMQEGILREGGIQTAFGGIGRKSLGLEIHPDAFFSAGLNISRHDFSIGLSDFAGNIHFQVHKSLDPSMSSRDVLEKIWAELQKLILPPLLPGKFLGLGITAPGPLDARRGMILNPPNFEKWSNLPIVDFFCEKMKGNIPGNIPGKIPGKIPGNIPGEIQGNMQANIQGKVLLENNANALALAEKTYGLKGEYTSFMELVVDTGVGAGVIINNELFKGTDGFGNEVGHTTVQINGPRCSCGNYGCVELYASMPNLIGAVSRTDASLISWQEITEQAAKGSSTARAAIDLEAEYLACAIINAVNVLDVQAVVLTGDIAWHAEVLNKKISQKVNERFIARGAKTIEIISSRLVQDPVILSGANLIMEDFLRNGQ